VEYFNHPEKIRNAPTIKTIGVIQTNLLKPCPGGEAKISVPYLSSK
jgi:hypothetical protein